MAENDVLWLEIFIPKSMQMPYSEFQIKRHIELLDKKAKQESPEEPELTKLFLVGKT